MPGVQRLGRTERDREGRLDVRDLKVVEHDRLQKVGKCSKSEPERISNMCFAYSFYGMGCTP